MNVATTRMAARMLPLRAAAVKQPMILRQSILRQARPFHMSRPLMRSKEDDHSAHTITGRLKTLKRIPPELLPLAVVILFALGAAAFAMGKKLITDKTLRLGRSKPAPKSEAH